MDRFSIAVLWNCNHHGILTEAFIKVSYLSSLKLRNNGKRIEKSKIKTGGLDAPGQYNDL